MSCLSPCPQADSAPGATPVFQEADVCGTLIVSAPATLSGTGYAVRVDYGGELSTGPVTMTHPWGDPNNDGTINFFNIQPVLNPIAALPRPVLHAVDPAPIDQPQTQPQEPF